MSLIISAQGKFWSRGAMPLDVVAYSSLYMSHPGRALKTWQHPVPLRKWNILCHANRLHNTCIKLCFSKESTQTMESRDSCPGAGSWESDDNVDRDSGPRKQKQLRWRVGQWQDVVGSSSFGEILQFLCHSNLLSCKLPSTPAVILPRKETGIYLEQQVP